MAKDRIWDATQQFILETRELVDRVKLLVIVDNPGRLRVPCPWFHETPTVATKAPNLRRSILRLREVVHQIELEAHRDIQNRQQGILYNFDTEQRTHLRFGGG